MDTSESLGFGQRMKLYSQNGFNLAIRQNGVVEGTQEDEDPECCLELISAGPGMVRIRGMETDLYLCFDSDGHLYGEQDSENDATVFRETLEGLYNAYISVKYPEWYVGIKRSGKPKPGPYTKYGQKAVRFLPRRLK
ncbi:hypothetical protein WA026_000376 [Henosepilachna vigintioctopunctata]|uniref:Fibroblast growth factor n=1 Tax=Henosepilachna vigintioctopunctata TaxID=420089 RepID=A0AAW1UXC8_9CUCU